MPVSYFAIDKAIMDAIISRKRFGIDFELPSTPLLTKPDALWGRVYNLRAKSALSTMGPTGIGESDHPGVMQIDISYPANKGEGKLLKKVDQVTSSFTIGNSLVYNTTELRITNVTVSPTRAVGGWIRISVSINYTVRANT